MHETPEDIERLQTLLDRSIERAGAFLRSSFEMPEHSLSAGQITRYLQGIQNVAFATTTAKGEPRVAPIGSLFYRGHFHIPTVATAARTRMVTARPAISLTHYVGDDLAIIVHGSATIIPVDHPDFASIRGDAARRERFERARLGRGRLSACGSGDIRHLRALSRAVRGVETVA